MLTELHRDIRGYSFLPEGVDLDAIPYLYATEETPVAEKIIFARYFIPNRMNAFEWFVAELDEAQQLAFGFVMLNGDAQNAEWGYVNLEELEGMLLQGQPEPVLVHRDTSFVPAPWADVREKYLTGLD